MFCTTLSSAVTQVALTVGSLGLAKLLYGAFGENATNTTLPGAVGSLAHMGIGG